MLTWNNFELFGSGKQIILKKLSPNFVDLWLFQRVMNDFLQQVTSNLLQRVKCEFRNE